MLRRNSSRHRSEHEGRVFGVMLTRHHHGTRRLQFYGEGIPYLHDVEIKGRLIVIEGPDGSGRSTQIQAITTKLESDGHAVINTGLKRSELIGKGILEAK